MTLVAWIFALVTAAIHILTFAWEALLFQRPGVHQGVFAIPTADVPAVRLWGLRRRVLQPLPRLRARRRGDRLECRRGDRRPDAVAYLCLTLFLSGIVLFAADRMTLGRERGKGVGGALSQSTPPLVALIAMAL